MKRTVIGLAAVAMWMLASGAASATNIWTEVDDAPALLPGQDTVGTGSLDRIEGLFIGQPLSVDVDLYRIKIVNHTAFSASTIGLTTADTRLYLFDEWGQGVTFSDDAQGTMQSRLTSQFLGWNGIYYLAVTRYNIIATNGLGTTQTYWIWYTNPYDVERAPDGPAQYDPLGGWAGGCINCPDTTYGVALTGVEYSMAGSILGDLNCDSVVDSNDVEPFVLALLAPADYANQYPNCFLSRADLNQDGQADGLDVQPFVDLLLVP